MGYLNPIEIMGYKVFVERAKEVDLDGLLLVDMPPTESGELKGLTDAAEVDLVFLVSPTTTEARTELIIDQCSGYLYYVSLKGVTGAAITDTESIANKVAYLKSKTELPVVIGFGIKDAESAAAMAALADGVVIGSALVAAIGDLSAAGSVDEQRIVDCVSVIAQVRHRLDESA